MSNPSEQEVDAVLAEMDAHLFGIGILGVDGEHIAPQDFFLPALNRDDEILQGLERRLADGG